MTPITIKRGTFNAHLYDVDSLMDLPLANVRKLWKLMIEDTLINKDAFATIQNWLPTAVDQTRDQLTEHASLLDSNRAAVEALRCIVASFGSLITKEQKAELRNAKTHLRAVERQLKVTKAKHDRANKLQIIFNEMTQI